MKATCNSPYSQLRPFQILILKVRSMASQRESGGGADIEQFLC
jgi:hypothetical protein